MRKSLVINLQQIDLRRNTPPIAVRALRHTDLDQGPLLGREIRRLIRRAPARAEVQRAGFRFSEKIWIPAFAGNTGVGVGGLYPS
jgi:hypothetical protein